MRAPWWLFALCVVFLAVLGTLFVSSLLRPSPLAFVPTPVGPHPVSDSLVVGRRVTVVAEDPERWVFFDFSRGSVVEAPGPAEWDLAVRRFHVISNGGAGFAGSGGARDLGEVAWNAVREAPGGGYVETTGSLTGDQDPANPALTRWYRYNFMTHLLKPRPRVYAIRTADGRYAKIRFLSYYCPEARPGCLTFEYAYQGDRSRRLTPGREDSRRQGGSGPAGSVSEAALPDAPASARPAPEASVPDAPARRSLRTRPLVERSSPSSSGSSVRTPPASRTTSAPTTSSGR